MQLFFLHSKLYFKTLWQSLALFLKHPSQLLFFPLTQKLQVFLVLTLLAAGTYLNTLGHQMAYDDEQVIRKNEFVLKGVKGIPGILMHDTYYSFYNQSNIENILPGGRYRPLSIITYAIEQQFVGVKHDSLPIQFAGDLNFNGRLDADEDLVKDYKLTEDDFFAHGLGLRHFINVILFALCIGFIYLFFAAYLPQFSPDVVFISCLLFAVHPMHAEVVANIKSRDELLSLLFIISSFIFAFRYMKLLKRADLLLFFILFFLALLSKEYAVTLVILIPCAFFIFNTQNFSLKELKVYWSLAVFALLFIVTYFTFNYIWFPIIILVYAAIGIKLFLKTGAPALVWSMGLALCLYFALRWHATADVGNYQLFKSNIISNPYLAATAHETIATKLFVLIKYVGLLFYPNPLISDYSFNTITYRNFMSWEVWVSILFYSSLLIATIVLFFKRHPLSFPLLLFWAFLLPIANIFVDIGATMGERLVFHASLGFCFVITWPINVLKNLAPNYLKITKIGLPLLVLLLVILGFWQSFIRNRDWENNQTLFGADLPKASKNIVLLSGVASNYGQSASKTNDIKEQKKLVQQSVNLIDKGLQQNAAYMQFYQTLALDFYIIKDFDKSASAAKGGLKVNPTNPSLKNILFAISKEFVVKGIEFYKINKKDSALLFFTKAIKANSNNADAFYNKAIILKQQGDTINAIDCLNKAIKIQPTKQFTQILQTLTK
jgi:tetratricopeptide (TPR) repeat protein